MQIETSILNTTKYYIQLRDKLLSVYKVNVRWQKNVGHEVHCPLMRTGQHCAANSLYARRFATQDTRNIRPAIKGINIKPSQWDKLISFKISAVTFKIIQCEIPGNLCYSLLYRQMCLDSPWNYLLSSLQQAMFNVLVNSNCDHPPREFDFLEKFWSNSPLCRVDPE